MTQLFDSAMYDQNESLPAHDLDHRHLRSVALGDDFAERTTQWRLDDSTIEIGRKGIRAAREALQDAARANGDRKPVRRAA